MPKIDPKYKLGDRTFVAEGAEINILLLGDASVGKTAMIHNFIHNKFVDSGPTTLPTVLDIYTKT